MKKTRRLLKRKIGCELSKEEAAGVRASVPPPTAPCDFAQELAQLRVAMQELMRERISAATQRQDERFHEECWR